MIFVNEIARNIPKNHEILDEITNIWMNTYRFGLKFQIIIPMWASPLQWL